MKLPALSLLACALLLAACVNLKPVVDSVRNFLPCPAAAEVASVDDAPSMGIREVSLPSYLSSGKIVLRKEGGELSYSNFNRWAEPLDEAAAATLARQLRARIGADRVDVHPWTDGVAHEVELRVQFDSFEGGADGGVHARGRFILRGADGATSVTPFNYEGRWDGHDYATLAQTLGNALDRLAADVVAKAAGGVKETQTKK